MKFFLELVRTSKDFLTGNSYFSTHSEKFKNKGCPSKRFNSTQKTMRKAFCVDSAPEK